MPAERQNQLMSDAIARGFRQSQKRDFKAPTGVSDGASMASTRCWKGMQWNKIWNTQLK
jgi:hypothetical protein